MIVILSYCMLLQEYFIEKSIYSLYNKQGLKIHVFSHCMYLYRRTPVSTCNTFEDLPRLRETGDNTESYI